MQPQRKIIFVLYFKWQSAVSHQKKRLEYSAINFNISFDIFIRRQKVFLKLKYLAFYFKYYIHLIPIMTLLNG